MSIYATLFNLRVPANGDYGDVGAAFIEICAQSVPPHIGHPKYYDQDHEAEWLPPPAADADGSTPRAVVFVDDKSHKGTERSGQEYANPILVLSGTEYETTPFPDLLYRLLELVQARWQTEAPCSQCGRLLVVDRDPKWATVCLEDGCQGTAQYDAG